MTLVFKIVSHSKWKSPVTTVQVERTQYDDPALSGSVGYQKNKFTPWYGGINLLYNE